MAEEHLLSEDGASDSAVKDVVAELVDEVVKDLSIMSLKGLASAVLEKFNQETPSAPIPVQQCSEVDRNTPIKELPTETQKDQGNDGESQPLPDFGDVIFHTRAMQFRDATRRVVMQSENGPCPLIAAVNALSLLGRLTIPPKSRVVETDDCVTRAELTDLIGGIVLIPPNISPDLMSNFEKKVADVLEILPGLGFGLDVNVKFNDVTAFEYTKQIDLFDLLNLRLYHAWKVEGEFTDAVGDQYYSQVSEKATTNSVLNDFLQVTQSQMTYSGLFALQETVPENAIAVLFRNNHFHTLLRQNNRLYLLATDEGFLGSTAYWEILENIEGDSDFVDMNFKSLKSTSAAASSIHSAMATPSPSTPERAPSSISDYELAKQLQDEEVRLQKQQQEAAKRQAIAAVAPPSARSAPQPSPQQPRKRDMCNFM